MQTTRNISSTQLKAAREALADAIEGTATLAGIFQTLRSISEDAKGFPFDAQIMRECDSMMTEMNRLLYEERGRLDHIRTMQKVQRQVKQVVSRAKRQSEANSTTAAA